MDPQAPVVRTGNECLQVVLWNVGALVIWPRENTFANRAEGSPAWAMDALLDRARSEDPAAVRTTAATLAPVWPAAVWGRGQPGQLLGRSLSTASALDDADTASMLLSPFMIEHLSRQHMTPLAELADRYGEKWARELLQNWFNRRPGYSEGPVPSQVQWFAKLPNLLTKKSPKVFTGLLLEPAWALLAHLISSAMTVEPSSTRQQQLARLVLQSHLRCMSAGSVVA